MFRVAVVGVVTVAGLAVAPSAWADSHDSLLWAGYASAVSEGSFDNVSARWDVPQIDCEDGETGTAAAVWVGLDGDAGTNNLVEQAGTTSECDGDDHGRPAYFAWAEAYPLPAVQVLVVRPGDAMETNVEVDNGQFTFTVHDITRDKKASEHWTTDGPGRSAEAVVEAPPGDRLPDFAPIQLSHVQVDGDPIGELDPDRVTLVKAGQPRVVRAKPTKLSDDGTTFDVRFRNH